MQVMVKATELGFYGGQRRREGDVFPVEVDGRTKLEAQLGSWMEQVATEEISETTDETEEE